jgi:hypothetical protein
MKLLEAKSGSVTENGERLYFPWQISYVFQELQVNQAHLPKPSLIGHYIKKEYKQKAGKGW